ncbi:MAG TPA: flagellar hook capping FlgD N-terminal domain-containing protein [Candidatus Acidoferrales bacterium]|jgi:flagellar basal-body rod modification protein FlgD|nr:flagellar hook capping FlgD N-terminal domain-containing protein [Candidatus Acidoferrales bacterium]
MSPVSSLNSNNTFVQGGKKLNITTAPSTPSSGTSQSTSPAAATGSTQVTKNMFLQLLVAQLKNQDPLQPADGTQFMTQLAQFQQLEQSMNTGQDITAIRQDLDTATAASAAATAATPKP